MLNRREAFTLAELLVAVIVAALVAGAAVRALIQQQRFFAADARTGAARAAVREGAEILAGELRALSPADGDIYAAAPDHVDVRLTIGTSVLCAIAAGRDEAVLPPLRAASELGLTAWVAEPQDGDTVLVLDAGSPAFGDERWSRHSLSSGLARGAICPVASGLTRTPGETTAGWRMRFTPPLAPTVQPGAPVRFARRARFELYRASDGRWFLGFFDCLASRSIPCSVVQPVSGPYEAAGVRFTYLDSLGAPAPPARVAQILIELWASAIGASGARWRDSARTSVAVRN